MTAEMKFDSVRCADGEELDIDVCALDRQSGKRVVGEWQRVCVEFNQAGSCCQVIMTGGEARKLRDVLVETLAEE